MMTEQAVERARLRWGCYRGMLELDLLLIPFFDRYFDELTAEQKKQFHHLLSQADPDLFAWLMGHQAVEIEELKDIVQLIQERT